MLAHWALVVGELGPFLESVMDAEVSLLFFCHEIVMFASPPLDSFNLENAYMILISVFPPLFLHFPQIYKVEFPFLRSFSLLLFSHTTCASFFTMPLTFSFTLSPPTHPLYYFIYLHLSTSTFPVIHRNKTSSLNSWRIWLMRRYLRLPYQLLVSIH